MNSLRQKLATFALILSGIAVITVNICCSENATQNKENTSSSDENNTAKQIIKNPFDVLLLNDETFDETINKGVVLVDFWATWCKPCRIQGPIIEELSNEIAGKAKICKIDVDKSPEISSRYGIQGIPTIIIFKDGKIVNQFVGITEKNILVEAINKLI